MYTNPVKGAFWGAVVNGVNQNQIHIITDQNNYS